MGQNSSATIKRSFLYSKIFKVIGPGKTTFRIHEDLLIEKSNVLAKAICGPMKESDSKVIEIEAINDDIDDDTVVRFLEFAYTNDYQVPEPEILQLSSDPDHVTEAFLPAPSARSGTTSEAVPIPEIPADELEDILNEPPAVAEEIDDEWYARSRKIKKDRSKKKSSRNVWFESEAVREEPSLEPGLNQTITIKRTSTIEPELELVAEIGDPPIRVYRDKPSPDPFKSGRVVTNRSELWKSFCSQAEITTHKSWLPPINNDAREDFSLVFLCHARLYKFSDRYECPGLMKMSLQKLRLTLTRHKFHQERATDVVELARYTYQHTMDFDEGQDKLRALVLAYVVCYIQQLSREPTFLDLLKEQGSLASDLLVKTVSLFD